MIWQAVARAAVAYLGNRPAGTGELARHCNVDPAFLDDALAPLVDAGKLMRINAFRNGAAEFDYRWSATWVPVEGDFDLCRGGGHAPRAAISPVAPATPSDLAPAAPQLLKPAHVVRPNSGLTKFPDSREERVAKGSKGATSKRARDALARAFQQAPQSLGWAPAPAATKESTMSTAARKPRATKAASAQFLICTQLIAKGPLSRDDLAAAVDADATAFTNAIYNGKAAGRFDFDKTSAKFQITEDGRVWATGGAAAPAEKPRATTDVKRDDAPLRLDATDDTVCAMNSRGELVIDIGDEVLIRFAPRRALALTRFLSGNTVLQGMEARGEL